MRNLRLLVTGFGTALVLVACSSAQSGPLLATPTTSTTPIPPPPPPPHYNSFSGRLAPDGEVLAVKIDDTEAAHPQIGLEEADVVYVEQVEGGLTRLAAIFSSKIPTRIGPVRSARISDIDLLGQYGKVAFAYSGAQRKMLPIIAAANLFNLGAQRESAVFYPRDFARVAPVNLILKARQILSQAPGAVRAHNVGWTFGAAPLAGKPLISVTVVWPMSRYRAVWSTDEKRWLLEHDRSPDLAASGVHLGPSTLVIQQVQIHPSQFGDKRGNNTPKSETIGTGVGWILRDGNSYAATWSRAGLADGTHWKSSDGTEIRFAPGPIWVFLSDSSRNPKFERPTPVVTAPAVTPTPSVSK